MKSSRLINSYLMTFMLSFDIFFQGHWNIQSRTFLLAIQPLVYSLRLLNDLLSGGLSVICTLVLNVVGT